MKFTSGVLNIRKSLIGKEGNIRPYLVLIFLVLFYYISTGLILGFTYETNDDPAFENCIRGVYWNTPISNFYFYYRGIAIIYVWLYHNLDIGINWYGWSLIFEGFITCLIISYILFRKTRSYWGVILFLMLYLQSVFLVSFTRTSIFLSFAALLLLFSADQFRQKRVIYFISILLFIWAYLVRPNAGLLSFLLIVPFIYNKYDITLRFFKRTIIFLIPVFIAFASNFVISSFQDKEYTQNIHRVANYIFPIIDYKVDLSSCTLEQKQIADELKNWFFFDHKLVELNTYSQFPDLLGSNNPKGEHIVKRLLGLFSMVLHKLFFALLFLMALIPLLWKKPFPINYLLSVLFFLSILFAIAIFLKLEYRIIIPFLTIFFIFIIYTQWVFYINFINSRKIIRYFFLTIIITLFLFQATLYYKKSKNTQPQSVLTELTSTTTLQTLILLTDPTLNYKPTQYIPFNSKVIFVPARGWTAYSEKNYKFQKEFFGTLDIAEVFKKIAQRNDILFISDSTINMVVSNILKEDSVRIKFDQILFGYSNYLTHHSYRLIIDTTGHEFPLSYFDN